MSDSDSQVSTQRHIYTFTGNLGVQVKMTPSGQAHDDFRRRMRALVEEVKARGEPRPEDQSISGLLLKLKVQVSTVLSVPCRVATSVVGHFHAVQWCKICAGLLESSTGQALIRENIGV